ncbi:MAG: hypothetical protein Q7T81_11680 [Pseudolabrys sp.]|nr:hypothetical protein [Pseudolabrys sp.]
MSDIEESWKKHMAPVIADGFALNPTGYERLSNWTFVLWQLLFTKQALQQLIAAKPEQYDKSNFYQLYSQFNAMIVTYGRCFATAGSGIKSLDAKQIFRDRPDLKKHHARMMEIRNGVVAHTGNHELARATIGVKEDATKITVRHMLTPIMPHDEYQNFLEVVIYVELQAVILVNKYIGHLESKFQKTILVQDLT